MMPGNRGPHVCVNVWLQVIREIKDKQPPKVVMKEREDEEMSYEGIREDKNKKISTNRVKGSNLMTEEENVGGRDSLRKKRNSVKGTVDCKKELYSVTMANKAQS